MAPSVVSIVIVCPRSLTFFGRHLAAGFSLFQDKVLPNCSSSIFWLRDEDSGVLLISGSGFPHAEERTQTIPIPIPPCRVMPRLRLINEWAPGAERTLPFLPLQSYTRGCVQTSRPFVADAMIFAPPLQVLEMVEARNTAGTNLLMVAATTGNTDVFEAVVDLLDKKLPKEQVPEACT